MKADKIKVENMYDSQSGGKSGHQEINKKNIDQFI